MTRIIAGFAGSRELAVPKSGTRPTSDRVREAVFSALDARNAIMDARVLDLFAGSGALGLEALSRGAASVVLVEKNPKAADVARRNAELVRSVGVAAGANLPASVVSVVALSTGAYLAGLDPRRLAADPASERGLENSCTETSYKNFSDPSSDQVLPSTSAQSASQAPPSRFDLVFIDPPYDLPDDELDAVLATLAPHLSEGADVIVERSTRSVPPVPPTGMILDKSKAYGETTIHYLSKV